MSGFGPHDARFNRTAPIGHTVRNPGLPTVRLMNGLPSGAAARDAQLSAHALLDELMVTLGESGLPAADRSPILLAAIDQHAAGIRDSLSVDVRGLTPIILAAYAEGVRDAAVKHGWHRPAEPIVWSEADWVLYRLLAVCRLARSLPVPA